MDCMRRVIGAHKSASQWGILVRMGIFPLQYEFVFRAILWYLKIHNGESDPVLTKQLEFMRTDQEMFGLTCFYRHCHSYIRELSKVGGVDIFACEPQQRKREIRKAMFIELDTYWQTISEARVLKSIHPRWEERRLSSLMVSRYTKCLTHNLALGRGPLRWTIHRKRDRNLQLCRHGCGEIENLNHLIFNCKKLKHQRAILKSKCTEINEKYELSTIFTATELQDDLERTLSVFFNITY